MILELFAVLVAICLAMIIIGLVKQTESAQALIGFFLLFILSLIVLNGGLQYQTGILVNTTMTTVGGVTTVEQDVENTYTGYDDDSTHNVGWYLAVASAVGFIGVVYSLRKGRNYD